MIKLFTWNANKTDTELLYKLLNFALGEAEPKTIIDLAYTQISKFSEDDLLIACGTRCYNLVIAEAIPGQTVTKIPLAKDLTNIPAHTAARAETLKTLQDLAKNKETVLPQAELTAKDLEAFDEAQLLAIKKALEIKNVSHWMIKTTEGKRIALVLDPNTHIQNCHAVLTFEEVFAAKFATTLLNLESITFILGDKK